MYQPEVSIVIPVKKVNNYIKESVNHLLSLDYENFEILIFPDEVNNETFPNTRLIPTGSISPAEKRDLSLRYAKGEVLAFLDDDAYPKTDWLKKAVRHFNNSQIAAVGGPAITPPNSNLYQKASAAVFESWLGTGNARCRYLPIGKAREVDDWPSVNLFVKKDIFEKIGGFNSSFWPGEDTKLCVGITKNLGKKIIYDPRVLVWHHRRPLFIPHLKQVWGYALHRGYFAKRFPQTSLRLSYFLPTLFLLTLALFLPLTFLSPLIKNFYLGTLALYFLFVILASLKAEGLLMGGLIFLGITLTHFFYGIGFLKGLLSRSLKEEKA